MNQEKATLFLFTISKVIKRSYESPVILLTHHDYADSVFDLLVEMRKLLMQSALPEQIIEVINTFHIGWLEAVQDIERYNKRLKETPRDVILKAIDYTMECIRKRYRYLLRYIDHHKPSMNRDQQKLLQAELETIGDMRELVKYALLDKQKCLRNQSDKGDFYVIIKGEIEELLNWLDELSDHVAIEFIKIVNLKVPIAPCDLVKVLEEVIDEVERFPSLEEQELAIKLANKSEKLAMTAIRGDALDDVVDKIKQFEDRLDKLKISETPADMATEQKTLYLKERLQSLQNLKLSLNCLKVQRKAKNEEDENDVRIFNHFLLHSERCDLVERLVELWNTAVGGDGKRKSIISILSATDIKEVFSDDIGHFSVDKYGRKIYTVEGDDTLYQLNEINELVPVDDQKHIFYYDECGRYHLNENRERIYKAHSNASEYLLHRAGFMVKVTEFEDNVKFGYDSLGRFYINKEGETIYKDKGSVNEYRHDSLGNLLRIRPDTPVYTVCPREPMVMEESLYLKHVVGDALKKCLANIVLVQPVDPINYLADSLEKYQWSAIAKQKEMMDLEELNLERERLEALKPIPTPCTDWTDEEEASTIDLNIIQYETQYPDF